MTTTTAPAELREVSGPSAFGVDPKRFWRLLWFMSVFEFSSRYTNTVLGYVWTIAQPLIFFGVIFLVLREILRFGADIENYALMLVLNIVLFQYFQQATNRGVRAVSSKEGIVRKMQFPRIVIPLSVSLTATFSLLLSLVAVLPLFLISGLEPRLSWLLLILLVAMLVVLTTGIVLIVSVAYVRAEDTAQVWTLISRMLFYAAPILYPITLVPDSLQAIIAANPLSLIFTQARVWVIDPSAPNAVEAVGLIAGLLIP
ncbi:MAG: ABC transporter permease, partial [Solirubrobacterales bacterium]